MSDFTKLSQSVHARYNAIAKNELFVVDITGDELYAAYLAAFPAGTNPIYRERTEHDCSCCRNFIKNLGGVVAIVNGQVQTVWDSVITEYPYNDVSAAMAKLVKNATIADLYRTKERSYGAEVTYELIDGQSKAWNHFHGAITTKHFHTSPGQAIGEFNTAAAVFKRGLTELTHEAINTVMYSPNHWDGQAVGNKHWFFVLDGCRNDEPTRGIYNEYLKSELDKHRKVFEVLGSKTMCPPTEEQLSGLGFSSTRGDSVIVQVTTAKQQSTYNIQF